MESFSKRAKETAASFNWSEMCALVKMKCETKVQVLHCGGGIVLFLENHVVGRKNNCCWCSPIHVTKLRD